MSTPCHGDHTTDPSTSQRLHSEVRRTCGFMLAALLAAATARAATVTGRVVDQQGAAVPRARVVISSPVGVVAERSADERGGFDISGLTNGHYEIRGFADGFQGDPRTVDMNGWTNPVIALKPPHPRAWAAGRPAVVRRVSTPMG